MRAYLLEPTSNKVSLTSATNRLGKAIARRLAAGDTSPLAEKWN